MILNEQTVLVYQELLTNPGGHGLSFKPITECFSKSDTCVAKHELFNSYNEYLGGRLPKVIGYIIMDNVFGVCSGKDESGNLGYYLQFNKP